VPGCLHPSKNTQVKWFFAHPLHVVKLLRKIGSSLKLERSVLMAAWTAVVAEAVHDTIPSDHLKLPAPTEFDPAYADQVRMRTLIKYGDPRYALDSADQLLCMADIVNWAHQYSQLHDHTLILESDPPVYAIDELQIIRRRITSTFNASPAGAKMSKDTVIERGSGMWK
jgi:hypothetical protein